MNKLEAITLFITITSYIFTIFLGKKLLLISFILNTLLIIVRCLFAKHLPIMGTYEASLSTTWITTLILITIVLRDKNLKGVIKIPVFFNIMLLFYGLFFTSSYIPLTISEQSLWVDLHAIFAWMSYGFYLLSITFAMLFLKNENPLIEDYMFYTLINGFIFQSLMIATGVYYNFILFGKCWRWDLIETLSLIAWLFSALVIHIKLFYKWNGRHFAYIILLSFLFILILHKGIPLLPKFYTFHKFDLDF